MDFQLTQDQETIRDMVRDFARNEIEPGAFEWDEAQHFPRELFTKLGDFVVDFNSSHWGSFGMNQL